MNNQSQTPQAKSERSPDRRGMGWKIADVKAATRRRTGTRVVDPTTMTFTSDPQSAAPQYYDFHGTTRA